MTSLEQIEVGRVAASELPALSALLQQALHFDQAWVETAFRDIGLDNFFVARQRRRVVAGCGLMPMAQWFGAQKVPCAGVTFVGVAWEMRGAGVGQALMRAILAEAQRRKLPLAVLYPSSVPFYRRVGYGPAGTRLTFEAPLDAMALPQPELRLRAVGLQDHRTLREIYARYAPGQSALLERPLFVWRKLLQAPGSANHMFVADRRNTPEGYLVVAQGSRAEPLLVRDLCAITPDARTRLLGLLAAQRTMVSHARWHGAPGDPLADLLATSQLQIKGTLDWMLRIVDVQAALSRRGYKAGQNAELHLEIHDDVLPWNKGRFVLVLTDGRPEVLRGGRGDVALHVRELASVYSGHRTTEDLLLRGSVAGSAVSLATMDLVFGWQRPRLSDMF